ncbi:hypothetical protein MicvaDRAFT_3218 [Microcoleus vaginatus FGP-2]|nr:hypothetical protein MicvaDRAFT_3218 [Microcoleus vaginatus FGP-2]
MESSHCHDIFKAIVKLYFREMANCVVCEKNVRSRKCEPQAKNLEKSAA